MEQRNENKTELKMIKDARCPVPDSGLALVSVYPLWKINDYSGRSR